ncbi:MAG TPA: ROK family transcriptional regulator [Nitriliruptorales bacterium]
MTHGNATTGSSLLSPSAVGDINRSRVLQALWDHGPQSRADLARLAGVTRGTIGNIVQSLLEAALLEEGEPRTGQVGKPAVPLWFTEQAGLTPVATLDSSGVQAALVNARGDVLVHEERPFDGAELDVDTTRCAVLDALAAVAGAARTAPIGVGIAVPGVYDPAARAVLGSTPVPALVGDWLPSAVEDALGLPVVVENDSRVQALGEKWFGDGRGLRTFASLQTGHGLGVGMVIDGQVFRGGNAHAAEFGHTCVVVDGDLCVCGLRGCWETIATLRWLRAQARASGLPRPRSVTGARLAEHAATDGAARRLLERYADHLAVGIANLQQVFAPETVILHGDAAAGGELLRGLIEDRTRTRVFPGNADEVDVRISTLGARAGLVGAAALVFSEHFALTA